MIPSASSHHPSLPLFVRDMLGSVPRHGEGVHNWLFRVARVLHAYRTEAQIAPLLHAASVDCGRVVSEAEIQNAIKNSKAVAWQGRSASEKVGNRTQCWPSINVEQRQSVVAKSDFGLVDLWEISPVRFDDAACRTEVLVDTLFPGNPWLCIGESARKFRTQLRNDVQGKLGEASLIVPSPMTGQYGTTKDGRESQHTLENTGPRRFLVVEFDSGDSDEHAAVLVHLAQYAPLALAVHSGGKSLHGWFFCDGQPEELLLRFFRKAVTLGADPATWTRSQFVRMPDGRRDNGKQQTVYYFAPEVLK